MSIRAKFRLDWPGFALGVDLDLPARGVTALTVVYSRETPAVACRPPGSVSFVPAVAGLILAGVVIRALAAGGRDQPQASQGT